MKSLAVLATAMTLCFVASCTEPVSLDSPESSAKAWLSIVDDRDYEAAWSESSSILKDSVSQPDWSANLESIRRPLGPLIGRELDETEYHDSLPEMPDGRYALLIYSSEFEKISSIAEVVGVMEEENSKWRVIGYYIP